MTEKRFKALLQFTKDYPHSNVNLDDLVMIFNASKAVLQSQAKTPTLMEIIAFSKVVVLTIQGTVCPSKV
jgi:hypothetical protein